LKSQTSSAKAETISAAQAASAPKREVSPFASSPSVAPIRSEIAEVTVIAVWRELQKSQKTSPEKRQAYRPACGGSWASEASAMPAGSR
jgi:hypothetical protein